MFCLYVLCPKVRYRNYRHKGVLQLAVHWYTSAIQSIVKNKKYPNILF